MKKNKKSGIILITTLIFMSLTFMLAVMICKNGKESLFAANRYADNEQAYLAAVSGIEFIKSQLYKDKDWLLSEENLTKYLSVNSNTIKIEQDDDVITGYILLDPQKGSISEENYDSKFEIFLINDSSEKKYKSINNLFNNRNISNPENKRDVPAKSFYAYVKGSCGKTVRYAEALLISKGTTTLDGGNVINGKVTMNSINNSTSNDASGYTKEVYTKENPFITINDKNKNKYGKITASGKLEFNSGDSTPSIVLNSTNNTMITSNGIKIGAFEGQNMTNNINEKDDSAHIQYEQYDSSKISDELKNYSDSNLNEEHFTSLKEGTYIFINDLDNSLNSKWILVNNSTVINQNNIASVIENNNKTDNQITPCEGIEFVKKVNEITNNTQENTQESTTQETRTVKITGKIETNGSLNFIVVDKSNKKGYTLSNINTVDFSMKEDSIIKTTDDMYINGEVTGSGKIYCGGNLTMNAGSQLETKTQSGVAVYAEGNINIKEAKNLSYDSNKMENIILEEAVKEAKEKLNISDETEININGRNIELATMTNSDTADIFCSFDRTKWKRGHHWEDLSTPIKYKVEIKDSSIYIYENDNPIPMFTRTFNEIKEQMYSYYYPEEYRRTGQLIIYNDMDNPNKVNSSDYWYYDKGIKTDRITIKDYNRHIVRHGPHKENDDNYMGDMTLYIDDYLVGIIDINKDKMDIYRDNLLDNKFIVGRHRDGKPDHILLSTGDYKGNKKIEHCFTDFTGSTSTAQNDQGDSNNTDEIIADTIQEYVDTYYKKQVSNTEIKGTVFSKNGEITIDGSGGKFNILGALITANNGGNLTINNASYINMTYDPDYVPFFKNEGILTTTIFESVF